MIEAQNGYDKSRQKLFDIEYGTEYGNTKIKYKNIHFFICLKISYKPNTVPIIKPNNKKI